MSPATPRRGRRKSAQKSAEPKHPEDEDEPDDHDIQSKNDKKKKKKPRNVKATERSRSSASNSADGEDDSSFAPSNGNSDDEDDDPTVDQDTKPPAKKRRTSQPKTVPEETESSSPAKQVRKRRATRARKEAVAVEESDVAKKDGTEAKRSNTRGSKNPKSAGQPSGRGPVESRTCQHCGKVICSKLGLKYHIDNFVCRIEQCTDPVLLDKATRKRGKNKTGTESKKRCRGSLENRTCEHCNRVFTSVLGAEYHKKHKVCQQPKKEKNIPFHQLNPGERFVTKFGVVEVVRDERETPTAKLPPNIKTQVRSWQGSKSNLEAHRIKWSNYRSMHLRLRRRRINKLYEENELKVQQCTSAGIAANPLTRDSVFNAYFQGDPREAEHRQITPFRILKPNPMAPKESYPDRIVECIMIPDSRKRFAGLATKESNVGGPIEYAATNPTRLFLRRDALTEEYLEENPTFSCDACGYRFSSQSGLRYHVQSKVCLQKHEAIAEMREKHAQMAEEGADRIELGQAIPINPDPAPANRPKRDRSQRVRKKKELGIYPEVMIFLGFQFVKADMEFTDDIRLPRAPSEIKEEPAELQNSIQVDPPDALLADLKRKYMFQRREADDQKYGGMYRGVWKALRFKKGRQKRKVEGAGGQRKRRKKKEKPPPPPKPLPPIIDTRALADEIDSGRYPSMNRYKEGEHQEICVLCKDGGDLICCDFCSNAEHLTCIRLKFTVKDPEPKDDFICHKCIQTVLARRTRAEKRRREKQERDLLKSQQEALAENKKTSHIEQGKEYEYMANQGKSVKELVELLQDAHNRLQQCLATTTMNNARRRIMGCARPEP